MKGTWVRVIHIVVASVMLACTAVSLAAIALELAVHRLIS
ncbi:hypothetical protein SAMN05421799_10187 [Alicyclobacillus vulcanalis]|uniref:Uncharacterized protein n=1 Tax=Alicyclobacillus vulcanalis TaxID=252246 RepID=A0A1N7JMV0_9BACL|nr:hypothetical protein SAMN05421799_10187 [Alicyclobacillus vulcanalis]